MIVSLLDVLTFPIIKALGFFWNIDSSSAPIVRL